MCFFGFMVEEDGSIHLWQINWRKTNLTLKLKQICSCGMIIKDSNDNRWNGPQFILNRDWMATSKDQGGSKVRTLKRKAFQVPQTQFCLWQVAKYSRWRLNPVNWSSWLGMKEVKSWVQDLSGIAIQKSAW